MKIRLSQNSYKHEHPGTSLIVTPSTNAEHYYKDLPSNDKLLKALNDLIPDYMHKAISNINSEIAALITKRAELTNQFREDYYKLIDHHQETHPEYYI